MSIIWDTGIGVAIGCCTTVLICFYLDEDAALEITWKLINLVKGVIL